MILSAKGPSGSWQLKTEGRIEVKAKQPDPLASYRVDFGDFEA